MQKRSEETRARILSAAIELFSREGYEATGVAEICQAAGVSKGAFYHHFPSKHDVFMQLLEGWLTALDVQLLEQMVSGRSVPQALLHMAGLMQGVFQQASGNLPMFLEFWTQASRDPLIWQAVTAPYQRYQEFFKSILQRGMDEGSLRQMDPDLAARTLVALAVGLLFQGVLDGRDDDWAKAPAQSIRVLLDGMASERK
ncbi:MAG: TetR/AcrR family transcriptional regulator [Anaerolineales bacterium]|nr:TetR/AcrR family transcriptional regulator [Anaerolineales bacterium]